MQDCSVMRTLKILQRERNLPRAHVQWKYSYSTNGKLPMAFTLELSELQK